MRAEAVLNFWFEEIDSKKWWAKDTNFDELICDRFKSFLDAAMKGELFEWRETVLGRLAEVIVLDQFSRNIYRDSAGAFAGDGMALILAQEAVALKLDGELNSSEKAFLYMPYMHSESKKIHEQAVILFDQPGLEKQLEFEYKHKKIIDRFGRYPHRNIILGRESSPDEIEFLKQPGSSF